MQANQGLSIKRDCPSSMICPGSVGDEPGPRNKGNLRILLSTLRIIRLDRLAGGQKNGHFPPINYQCFAPGPTTRTAQLVVNKRTGFRAVLSLEYLALFPVKEPFPGGNRDFMGAYLSPHLKIRRRINPPSIDVAFMWRAKSYIFWLLNKLNTIDTANIGLIHCQNFGGRAK